MKKHIYYFDYLKIIASVSVVLMHTSEVALRTEFGIDWQILNIFISFAFTAVPLFFFMSGYLVLNSKITLDTSHLIKKRIPRILLPTLFWSIIVSLLFIYVGRTTDGISAEIFGAYLLRIIEGPIQVAFWYAYTLIALYLISPVIAAGLQALDKKGERYILTLIIILIIQSMLLIVFEEPMRGLFNIDVLNQLSLFGGHLISFVLGYFLGKTKYVFSNKLLIGVFLVMLTIITLGTSYLTLSTAEYNQSFQIQSAGFEIILAGSVFLLFKQNLNRPLQKNHNLVKSVVSLSFSVYLMHSLVIVIYKSLFPMPITFINTIFISFLIYFTCYIIAKTLSSIKIFSYVGVGVEYSKSIKTCNWQYTVNNIKKHIKEKR